MNAAEIALQVKSQLEKEKKEKEQKIKEFFDVQNENVKCKLLEIVETLKKLKYRTNIDIFSDHIVLQIGGAIINIYLAYKECKIPGYVTLCVQWNIANYFEHCRIEDFDQKFGEFLATLL